MPDSSARITFVIFTFNEEKRIERVVRNFVNFGDVLVVDNESTDRTREIAQKHGCDILINKNAGWVEDEVTTARVQAAAKTDWIYWGFADEMVDRAAIEMIIAAVRSDKYDIVNIARKNYYYGTFCHDLSPDRMNRIFRKNAIDFSGNKLHCFGRVVPGTRIHKLPLKHFVHHFISNTAKSYLHAMDRYTDMENMEDRAPLSLLRLFVSTAKTIILNVLIRRGYRGRTPGCLLMCNIVYYRWLSAMKNYEKRLHLDRDVIELRNDQLRDHILRSLQ
jgi:glycosyltransferase involved in cell wall biosynthesis